MIIRNHMKCYEQAVELINCLKEKNFFQYSEQNASKYLEIVTPETLQNYIIVMEKAYNTDKVEFKYIPQGGILVRIKFSHPESLRYENKKNYSRQFLNCPCKNPCYKGTYAVKDFIELVNRGIFEPVEFYPCEKN